MIRETYASSWKVHFPRRSGGRGPVLGVAPTAVGKVGGRGAAVAMGAVPLSKEEGARAGLPACRWLLRSLLLVERWIGVRLGGGG